MGSSDQSFDVFFSYHWRDHDLVEAVAHRLTERGLRVFLDRWYLTPGQPWTQALERTLASCSSVAVFLGTEVLGSWQQRERDLALDRQGQEPGFPVIPVLLTRADPALGFLKLNTWVDLSANIADETALDLLCAAIRRQPPGPAALQQIAAVRAAICPYRGLRPFREEDAAFFCGRATVTEKLVGMVERTSLVAVIGASGSGKSSVVRAGLIPRLRQTKVGQIWEIATLVPTDRPLHSLAAALIRILEPEMTRVDRLAEINKLARHLADGTVALRDVAADLLRAQPGTDRLLLFVDQWEELYTLVSDDQARQRFLAEILDVSRHEAVTVVFTLRGDFFGQALSDRPLADRLQDGQVNLGPMTPVELRHSIVEPAEKANLLFEHGLVDRILDDVGQEPGNLPLLEFVLASLWEQRQGITLLHDAYERMGGVQGAIAARANAEFEKLDADQKDAARRYLVQMVRPGEATGDTRQRAFLPSENATALAVIRRLADARLVVTGRDAATGEETVEVTHEALIRNWTLLRGWVDADRDFLRTKARIEAAAALWEREKRDPSRLLPAGRPLDEGQAILASRRADLRPGIVAFIEASTAAAARSRRRTLLGRAAALAAVLLGVAGSGLYWDLYVRQHEEYYNSFAKRWGVFEGVGRVSAGDAAHRSRTLRFVRKGRLGPVTRVDAIDGSGACARTGFHEPSAPFAARDNSPLCSIAWERDTRERVSRQIMLDGKGQVLARLIYTDADGRTAEFRSEQGHLVPMGDATTVTYESDEDGPNRGLVRRELWSDAFGRPKLFLMRAFGSRAEYNPQGLPTRIVSLGQDGAPMRNSEGFAQVRIAYNEAGGPTEVVRLDERGDPVRSIARWTRAYDAHGNETEEAYFDGAGKPTLSKDGYAKVIFGYDARGKEKERAYFDEAGRPTRSKDGYARIVRAFDARGQLIEEAYFDELGNPALSRNAYAKVRKNYDVSSNPVEEAYFDLAGKPTLSKDGYARMTKQFDTAGRPIAGAYFDGAGKPTLSKDGYAKITLAYDARGKEKERAYFDEAGNTTRSKDGYARIARRLDASGQPLEDDYFDEFGKPTLSKDGYARVTRDYDASGNLIEETYFDEAGKPTLSKDGYAEVQKQFDGAGRLISEAYFDGASKPTLTKGGFASVVFENDLRGNMIKRSYYDENKTPVRSKDNYASLTRIYDERGNVVEEAYFDEAGKPCRESGGYAKMVAAYDARGNKVLQSGFDEQGEPTRSNEGAAEIARKYDGSGNVLEEAYFDEKRNPTRLKYGHAKIVRSYDGRGSIVEEAYFDEEGNPAYDEDGYARLTQSFDARGNAIDHRYFDEKMRPVRSKDGYARRTWTYDQRDNVTEEDYFDESGNSVRSKDGYAKIVRAYDSRRNKIEVSYLDELGKPTRSREGYATQKVTYDARGNAISATFLDETGKPTRNADGIVGWTAAYDARGNVVEARGFDEHGKPTRGNDGYAMLTKTYDSRDNLIRQAYFDEQGIPVRSKRGDAITSKRYDARGNVVEEAYFDEDGSPTRLQDGYAVMTRTYDARGNLVQEAYFDERRNAVRSKDGYASVTKRYDARGDVNEEAYFDEQGDLTRRTDGYARIIRAYDTRGRLIEQTYLDESGITVGTVSPGK
ncbi:TIR domain-containing protein [Microvirga massiliensis]|uniref:nSTAND1 domain-containing NTPase n=1 Tax=Microvirga massiliensis TaxID=1033741 RepID=UPI00065FED21|nr:TIR domain-containing protein [Microvirga massiliensis]